MNSPITRALVSLLPTLTTLPPELLDLATALLAQSHNKASSMKQDEEIARPYACAHLACDRLKTKLDLPTITARPPCPPRTYKKLFTFLESVMFVETPRKTKSNNCGRGEAVPVIEGKRPRLVSTTDMPTKRRRGTRQAVRVDVEDLSYLLPAIRGVCAELESQACTPHVYTGLCTIYNEGDREILPEQLLTLLLAVCVAVVKVVSAKLIPCPYDIAARKLQQYTKIVDRASTGNQVFDSDVQGRGAAQLLDEHEKSWQSMDWYQNIQHQVDDSGGEDKDKGVESFDNSKADDDDLTVVTSSKLTRQPSQKRKAIDDDNEGMLRQGLGTMFCEAVDWQGEDHRAGYIAWKLGITARVESLI